MATRANIEQELVDRAGGWMATAGLAVTFAGANASLNSPLAWAIRQAGGSVASPALVTDADVLTVEDLDLLYDLAELRTLQNTLAHFSLVDVKAGPVEAKNSQLADVIARRISQLQSWLATAYGIGNYGAFSVQLTRIDGYSDL